MLLNLKYLKEGMYLVLSNQIDYNTILSSDITNAFRNSDKKYKHITFLSECYHGIYKFIKYSLTSDCCYIYLYDDSSDNYLIISLEIEGSWESSEYDGPYYDDSELHDFLFYTKVFKPYKKQYTKNRKNYENKKIKLFNKIKRFKYDKNIKECCIC